MIRWRIINVIPLVPVSVDFHNLEVQFLDPQAGPFAQTPNVTIKVTKDASLDDIKSVLRNAVRSTVTHDKLINKIFGL